MTEKSPLTNPKYRACTLGEIASSVGMPVHELRTWITEADWIELIRCGFRPYVLVWPPRAVEYLREKVIKA